MLFHLKFLFTWLEEIKIKEISVKLFDELINDSYTFFISGGLSVYFLPKSLQFHIVFPHDYRGIPRCRKIRPEYRSVEFCNNNNREERSEIYFTNLISFDIFIATLILRKMLTPVSVLGTIFAFFKKAQVGFVANFALLSSPTGNMVKLTRACMEKVMIHDVYEWLIIDLKGLMKNSSQGSNWGVSDQRLGHLTTGFWKLGQWTNF